MSEDKESKIDNLPLTIHAQYIRDISFENPQAPQSLRGPAPKMNVDFNMDSHRIESVEDDMRYEVILSVRAEAKRDDKTIFLAEVHYSTIVSVNNIPAEYHRPTLLIEIPRLAFPFVRQILADLTQQGGFPPLLLHPVNFHQLYTLRFGETPGTA